MAEEQGADVGAGEANGADEQPQLAILAQYVQDLSFENPNAPQVFQSSGQPKLDVNVNVVVTRPGEDVCEVATKINRSEGRRVGHECVSTWRSRGSREHKTKKKEKNGM